MPPTQARRIALQVLAALAAGVLGGYLAALIRPRPPEAYASAYAAPSPEELVLPAAPDHIDAGQGLGGGQGVGAGEDAGEDAGAVEDADRGGRS